MKVIKFLDKHLEEVLIVTALIVITVVMTLQIILRSFGFSIRWAEEVCRYLFVWCGALGISYAANKNSHLRLDILPTFVPALRKPLEILASVVLLAVCVYLMQPGLKVYRVLASTGQTSTALQLKMQYVYLSMLVGLTLTSIRIVENAIKAIVSRKANAGEVDSK